jgi:hypothetical protein
MDELVLGLDPSTADIIYLMCVLVEVLLLLCYLCRIHNECTVVPLIYSSLGLFAIR